MKQVIASMLFLNEKFRPDGSFEKLEARLVAGGHMQDKDLYHRDDISFPTVATQSVMAIAAIAAKERREVVPLDIGVAYLSAEMPNDRKTLMKLSREHAEILCWMKP